MVFFSVSAFRLLSIEVPYVNSVAKRLQNPHAVRKIMDVTVRVWDSVSVNVCMSIFECFSCVLCASAKVVGIIQLREYVWVWVWMCVLKRLAFYTSSTFDGRNEKKKKRPSKRARCQHKLVGWSFFPFMYALLSSVLVQTFVSMCIIYIFYVYVYV